MPVGYRVMRCRIGPHPRRTDLKNAGGKDRLVRGGANRRNVGLPLKIGGIFQSQMRHGSLLPLTIYLTC